MERKDDKKVLELKPHLVSSNELLGEKKEEKKQEAPPEKGVRLITEKEVLLQICLELQTANALLVQILSILKEGRKK